MAHAKCESVAWQKVLVTFGIVTISSRALSLQTHPRSRRIYVDAHLQVEVDCDRSVHKDTDFRSNTKKYREKAGS